MIKTRALDEKEACGILELQLGGSSKPFLAFFIRFSTSSQYCRNSFAFSLTPISKEPLLRRSTAQARRAAGHQRQARRRRRQGHLGHLCLQPFCHHHLRCNHPCHDYHHHHYNHSCQDIYESIATVGEIRVYWRADFQSGSRVLKKVF